jgi:hypothetical protein
MMSNADNHPFASRTFAGSEHDAQQPGLLERFLRTLQIAICGLHGHDSVLQYEGTRMFLRCTSCGSETPGWDLAPGPDLNRGQAAGVRPALNAASGLTVVRKVA